MVTDRAAQVIIATDSGPVRAASGAMKGTGPEKQEWLPIEQRD